MLLSIVLVASLCVAALNLNSDFGRSDDDLNRVRIYCAASVAEPVEKIIETFNQKFAMRVEIVRIGGSGELAGQIKMEFETGVENGADLFLSADDILLAKARAEGVVSKRFSVAEQLPVIAVRAESSLEISSLRELVSMPCKFGIASKRAAIGKMVRDIAQDNGLLNMLETRKATDAENVMTLAQALSAGSLDAAIVWDTTVKQVNATEGTGLLKIAAMADSNEARTSNIEVGLVHNSAAALKFCQFLVHSRESHKAFQSSGFSTTAQQANQEVDPAAEQKATSSKAGLL